MKNYYSRKNKETVDLTVVKFTVCVFCGGDEGSRTPVRKYCNTTFSERRRHTLIRFLSAYRRAHQSLSR